MYWPKFCPDESFLAKTSHNNDREKLFLIRIQNDQMPLKEGVNKAQIYYAQHKFISLHFVKLHLKSSSSSQLNSSCAKCTENGWE